jgi:hypothetical protein
MQVKKPNSTERRSLKHSICGVYHSLCHVGTYALGCSASISLTLGWSQNTLAQVGFPPPTTNICDVNLDVLKSNDVSEDPNIVTADTVSAQGTTVPSLWWTSEQFPAKLVTNWVANRNHKQIYLLVNNQYWNVLDYVNRYRTIDKFGRVAQSYGYNLKICNSQKIALARYTCDSIISAKDDTKGRATLDPSQERSKTQNSCQIWLNVNGQDGMGVSTN